MKHIASTIAFICLFNLFSRHKSVGGSIFLPNGLSTAKAGDWALYRIPNGYAQRLSIVRRIGEGPNAEVAIRIESIMDGKVVEFSENTHAVGEPTASMPELEDGRVRVALSCETMAWGGKELSGYSMNVTRGGRWLQKWYISPMVPIYGLVKCETDDGSGDFTLLECQRVMAPILSIQ